MQTFLAAAADEVTSRLASANATSFSRQHLANFIWAYATLEVGCCSLSQTQAAHASVSACRHSAVASRHTQHPVQRGRNQDAGHVRIVA